MRGGISSFQPKRLTQAREARGLSAITLADIAGVSPATISQYENDHHKPRQDTLDSLARGLNLPTEFFLRSPTARQTSSLFYRSMSSATKTARARAQARYQLFLEALDYLLEFFDLPDLFFPDFDVPEDFRAIDRLMIERWATTLREHWQLGSNPVANLMETLENNGIVVWRTPLNADTMDAFSEHRLPHPVVVLSSDKENYFRSRADAAHELGHLVMHRNVDRKALTKKSDFKILEDQAHYFGGAFLLPAEEFEKELWGLSLDTYRSLKSRWNVSMGLQIRRSHDLGLLTEDQERRLWINRSRRGWHRNEPLDDSTPAEQPSLVGKCFKMLIESKVKTREQIVKDLSLTPSDIESIGGLAEGYIGGRPFEGDPKIKPRVANVIPFRRS